LNTNLATLLYSVNALLPNSAGPPVQTLYLIG
jgi:hypothetical protein